MKIESNTGIQQTRKSIQKKKTNKMAPLFNLKLQRMAEDWKLSPAQGINKIKKILLIQNWNCVGVNWISNHLCRIRNSYLRVMLCQRSTSMTERHLLSSWETYLSETEILSKKLMNQKMMQVIDSQWVATLSMLLKIMVLM